MARTARTESLTTTHKVRAWRQNRGLTLEKLAEAIGMSHQNLGRIERGLVPLGEEHHAPLAAALNITPPDLFRDPSAPLDRGQRYVRIIGRAGADTEGRLVQSDADENYDYAPFPPGGTSDAVAVRVVGDSMRAIAEDGALIYFRDQRNPPTPDMIGYNCIVELEDGRVLFKRLLRGPEPGIYMLESQVGPPIEARIRWAAEPTAIIPAKEARRIIRRADESQVA
jgi:transcriptional regulator with XRE-family HTH domain